MHARLDHHRMNDDAALTAALRALPACVPTQDGFPQLAARIQRRRNLRKLAGFALPAALAAGLALTFIWPHIHSQARVMPSALLAQHATPAHTSSATSIAALQASSRQWQAWVRRLDHDGAPLDGRALASAVSLQNRIGLIDLQLSAARDPATVTGLWQQRISLLQQLGLVHLQPYLVAEQARTDPAHAISM